MTRRAALVAAVALATGLPSPALGDAALSAAIDAVFADIDAQSEPGCVAGVIHRGEYIHKAGYGLANLEYGIALDSRSIFRTGSLGKQFTAMAIALLAERGDVDLDADVHDYLPDLVDYGHEVTLRQMIHHVSGMGDYDHAVFRKADGSEFRFGNEDYWTIDEFYRRVAQAGLEFEPGSRYQYSNLAYFLLGQVVEAASGQTLREFAAGNIFGPLGMARTRFNDNVNQLVERRADGYRRMADGTWEIFMTNLSWVGDGGVYTSLDDFIRWDRNFYANRLGQRGQALIDQVTTPLPGVMERGADGPRAVSYAFGLEHRELHGQHVIGHSGSWVAFTTVHHRYPALEMSVVVFCNSSEISASERGERIGALAVVALAGD